MGTDTIVRGTYKAERRIIAVVMKSCPVATYLPFIAEDTAINADISLIKAYLSLEREDGRPVPKDTLFLGTDGTLLQPVEDDEIIIITDMPDHSVIRETYQNHPLVRTVIDVDPDISERDFLIMLSELPPEYIKDLSTVSTGFLINVGNKRSKYVYLIDLIKEVDRRCEYTGVAFDAYHIHTLKAVYFTTLLEHSDAIVDEIYEDNIYRTIYNIIYDKYKHLMLVKHKARDITEHNFFKALVELVADHIAYEKKVHGIKQYDSHVGNKAKTEKVTRDESISVRSTDDMLKNIALNADPSPLPKFITVNGVRYGAIEEVDDE